MAYGNNRAGAQPRAHFQQAGGSIIKFRHPFLAGQIDTTGTLDEIDISACCVLEGTYFEATQNQDSARQITLIDGSVVTITNKLLNGTITMPVVRTTGRVATGDFISALQLIRATGDNVGGLLTKTDFINGEANTKVFYGVAVQSIQDDVSVGNDVAQYTARLLYSGWIEASSSSASENKKRIWAVGSQQGIEAFYTPYLLQNSDGTDGSESDAINAANGYGAISDSFDTDKNNTDGTTEKEFWTEAITATGWKSGIVKNGTVIKASESASTT